uniref:E3 SUMO-protein ligase NSE2 n=1 Tax=Heterorhabditis bacteriophora TaxID=37862 RepID=A0A1I7WJ47_HETBA
MRASAVGSTGVLNDFIEKVREGISNGYCSTGSDIDNGDDLQIMQQTYSRRDPITKKEITDPVKNKYCGHVYDRASMDAFITDNKKRRVAVYRCPNVGCGNNYNLDMGDMIDFPEFFDFCKFSRSNREITDFEKRFCDRHSDGGCSGMLCAMLFIYYHRQFGNFSSRQVFIFRIIIIITYSIIRECINKLQLRQINTNWNIYSQLMLMVYILSICTSLILLLYYIELILIEWLLRDLEYFINAAHLSCYFNILWFSSFKYSALLLFQIVVSAINCLILYLFIRFSYTETAPLASQLLSLAQQLDPLAGKPVVTLLGDHSKLVFSQHEDVTMAIHMNN